jgi:hypothetical protein
VNFIVHGTILAMSITTLAAESRAAEPLRANAVHARLHWSEPTRVVSPDKTWELGVFPVYNASQNRTPVVVRKRGGGRPNVVLTLRRGADIYWGGADRLLIIDRPTADDSRILLFRLGSAGDITQLQTAPDLGAGIRDRLVAALGRSEAVPFYLATFGSWRGSRLELMLGGTVVYRRSAPAMSPYCYRVTVDSRNARVESLAKETARDDSTKCAIFP